MSLDDIVNIAALVTAASTVIGVITAIVGLTLAYRQLRHVGKSIEMNTLAIALQHEAEMNRRKERCDELVREIRHLNVKRTAPNEKKIIAVQGQLEGALESWLNSIDRFASCILKGHFAEDEWKAEYREYIRTIVIDHKDKFGTDSNYTNIIDLHARWMRE